MPIPWVRAFAENREMVLAERQLQIIGAVQLAVGMPDNREEARRTIERLAASAQGPVKAIKPKSLAEISAIGIPVRIEEGG